MAVAGQSPPLQPTSASELAFQPQRRGAAAPSSAFSSARSMPLGSGAGFYGGPPGPGAPLTCLHRSVSSGDGGPAPASYHSSGYEGQHGGGGHQRHGSGSSWAEPVSGSQPPVQVSAFAPRSQPAGRQQQWARQQAGDPPNDATFRQSHRRRGSNGWQQEQPPPQRGSANNAGAGSGSRTPVPAGAGYGPGSAPVSAMSSPVLDKTRRLHRAAGSVPPPPPLSVPVLELQVSLLCNHYLLPAATTTCLEVFSRISTAGLECLLCCGMPFLPPPACPPAY
jgi:hypothetical protein